SQPDNLASPAAPRPTNQKCKQAAISMSADEASDSEGSYMRRQSYGRSRAPRTPKQRQTVIATKQEPPDHSTHSTSKVWLYFRTTPVENNSGCRDRRGRFPMVRYSNSKWMLSIVVFLPNSLIWRVYWKSNSIPNRPSQSSSFRQIHRLVGPFGIIGEQA